MNKAEFSVLEIPTGLCSLWRQKEQSRGNKTLLNAVWEESGSRKRGREEE